MLPVVEVILSLILSLNSSLLSKVERVRKSLLSTLSILLVVRKQVRPVPLVIDLKKVAQLIEV